MQLLTRQRFFRCWLGPKFFVSNLAAGVGDVTAHSENNCSGQNSADYQWGRAPGPFDWQDDGNDTESSQSVEKIDELFAAMLVLIKPGVPVLIGHRDNAIVSLFAEFIYRPGRRGADQDQNKGGDLCRPTAQNRCDHQSHPTHCQPVDGEGIEENMDIFRLTLKSLKERRHSLSGRRMVLLSLANLSRT